MKQISHILFTSLVIFLLSSCTVARWTVKDTSAVDRSNYEILEQHKFLGVSNEVTPEAPVLRLQLLSRIKYQYPQKVLVQRNIQDYRLRAGFTVLGLTGAAMAFFVANSTVFRGNSTSTKSMTLNAAGALLSVSGLLNMKPVGDPRPTSEERYLRQTGTSIEIDTVNVREQVSNSTASIEINYNGEVIYGEGKNKISSNQLEIPLGDKLSELQIRGPEPGTVSISVNFLDSTYTYKYPVEKILQPYAVISSQFAELRNSPRINSNNVLADLLKGSRVRVQDYSSDQWYRVLYGGITENYIQKEDANLVWMSSDFTQENQVVTVPRIPFGNIDVESNIPVLKESNPNSIALIVTNENYKGDLEERTYAHRDGKLIQTYLKNALGFSPQKIFMLNDVSEPNRLYRTLSEIRFAANDSTEFFVYMSGYGSVDKSESGLKFKLLSVQERREESKAEHIDLNNLLEQISTISSSQTLVVSDIDFSHKMGNYSLTPNEEQRIIESLASELISGASKASLLMGTKLGQPSRLYVSKMGEDKKHHIFPYFFAKAIQQRKTNLSVIYQFLERNISYTSRKLHDRPQDPLLMGNVMLDLVNK